MYVLFESVWFFQVVEQKEKSDFRLIKIKNNLVGEIGKGGKLRLQALYCWIDDYTFGAYVTSACINIIVGTNGL